MPIDTIELPTGGEEAAQALAPLREAGRRFVIDSERFLAFAESLPSEQKRAVALLSDKAAFRQAIREANDALAAPSRAISREELLGPLDWESARASLGGAPDGLVVKPVRGFQSDLVVICRDLADWEKGKVRIADPPPGISPVTDTSTFVIESYVRGEEYALDLYFDEDGAPVITGIYLHPFRDPLDARDIVYRTSPALLRRNRERFERALTSWNARLGLRDFPVHAEVRRTERGEVFPIELNPLRFGLLTMDIALYAFGVNAYRHYYQRTRPEWPRLESDDETATGLIVAPLPESCHEGVEIDYEAFEQDLQRRGLRVHRLERLPYHEIPFYAAAYASGPAEAMDEYLREDFGRWVRVG